MLVHGGRICSNSVYELGLQYVYICHFEQLNWKVFRFTPNFGLRTELHHKKGLLVLLFLIAEKDKAFMAHTKTRTNNQDKYKQTALLLISHLIFASL